MLQQGKKSYFNQVAMIESQYDSKRSNNSSLLINRSPLRERQNINTNTPVRVVNGKKSLSPLRTRKSDLIGNSSSRCKVSRRKNLEPQCQNHANKVAKFYIESERECLYYCENCAIRLASQGFQTKRLNETPAEDENPRLREINQFLESLEHMISNLRQKKLFAEGVLVKSESTLDTELERIQEYYGQFYQIIDEHKNRVIEEVRSEFDVSCEQVKMYRDELEDALNSSENMKKDINQSMNQVILDAPEYEFRPVMDLYQNNLKKFKQVSQINPNQAEIKLRKLVFRDSQRICQTLLKDLTVQWDTPTESAKQSEEGFISDSKNPLDSLQSQEQSNNKSNLKELGQLFSSFDQ